ncbi:hypothetical protein HK097_010674, partial [Rhizophlyctis rosea]
MDSLLLLTDLRVSTTLPTTTRARSLLSVDPDTADVYCSINSDTTSSIVRIPLGQHPSESYQEICFFPDPNGGAGAGAESYSGDKPAAEVVGLQYLPDSQALCCALAGGDIVLVRTDDEQAEPDVVGTVDSGILAMSWSPDHELVVMVTGYGTLLEMTKDFDVIAEVPIYVQEKGEDVQHALGWGKKETQFHGSEGKQAAQRKDTSDTGIASPDDDQLPRLSWRGDGNFFVCSTLEPGGDKRLLRVYNRECALQSTSETVAQLEHPLSWRPSGNVIASTQRLPHRHDVVFFERNGLRHGEFSIREPGAKVVELQWNADSSVLAVWLTRESSDSGASSVVQLWTSSNYYWYLKQEIRSVTGGAFTGVAWDPEIALRLHLCAEEGEYRRLEYFRDRFVSTSLDSRNPATVAVADGANVLLTPFKHLNVPPPMSALKASLPSPVSHVTFSPDAPGDDFVVMQCDSTVQIFQSMSITKPVKAPKPSSSFSLSQAVNNQPLSFRQLTWVATDTFLVLAYHSALQKDVIYSFVFGSSAEGSEPASVTATQVYISATRVVRLQHSMPLGITLVQTVDGVLKQLGNQGGQWAVTDFGAFPAVCPWMGIIAVGNGEKATLPVGLTERNKLYVGNETVASDCTSFFIHNDFLAFTTLTHAVRFVPTTAPANFKVSEAVASAYDETHRRVERGSRIVVAVPADIALVLQVMSIAPVDCDIFSPAALQMPRGNLETVYPRALVLSTVRSALDELNYKTAFLLCRKHRIDMNLLVDHNNAQFMDNVEAFVQQVDDPEYLNLFVSGLRDEDVTKTMYPGSGKAVQTGAVGETVVAAKVNTVCTAMCNALVNLDEERYVYTILTTEAKQVPPRLEEAMGRILDIKEKKTSDAAEAALKYLIFLADVDRLYDVALGMYDFALVLMVAQHSQKDPREYLPFLSELQKLEKNYQRFRIDDHLGKREKALASLSLAGDERHDEALHYIKRYSLHKAAVEIYAPHPEKRRAVMKLWAEDLGERGTADEAALLYVMAGEKRSAMECYRKATMWQEAMAIAYELGIEQSELVWMAGELADELVEQRKYGDAARVLLDHTKKPDDAVQILVRGSLWSEALRVAQMAGLSNMVDTTIKPGIVEGSAQLLEDIRELGESFAKQRDRLNHVREEKLKRAAEAEIAPHDERLDNIDLLSDTTSMATTRFTGSTVSTGKTGWTNKTGRSSKIRRKHERKRAAGKNPAFEEEFLVGSLRKAMVKSNTLRGDVAAIIRALLGVGEWDKAKHVQDSFTRLVVDLQARSKGVFVMPTQVPETAEEYKMRIMEGRPPPPPPVPTVDDLPPEISQTLEVQLCFIPTTLLYGNGDHTMPSDNSPSPNDADNTHNAVGDRSSSLRSLSASDPDVLEYAAQTLTQTRAQEEDLILQISSLSEVIRSLRNRVGIRSQSRPGSKVSLSQGGDVLQNTTAHRQAQANADIEMGDISRVGSEEEVESDHTGRYLAQIVAMEARVDALRMELDRRRNVHEGVLKEELG